MSKQPLPTLLLVADNPSVVFWIKKNLSDQFFVIEAQDRKSALDALNAKLDFIIIDSSFEAHDPLELCKELSKKTAVNLTPILLITNRLKKSYRDKALESGVTDFLSDQLDLEELETRIAIGRKGVAAKKKTEEISSLIHVPKKELSSAYLKKKFLLTNHALRLLAEAQKEKSPVSLLFLRIDHFNELQSRFAQSFAEKLLIPFSDFLSHLLPETDLLIPSSDGGFIVLLPNTDPAHAKSFAERLHNEIQHHRFDTDTGPVHLTVSIAFSSLEATENAYNRAVEFSSKALRQALPATNLIISLDQEKP